MVKLLIIFSPRWTLHKVDPDDWLNPFYFVIARPPWAAVAISPVRPWAGNNPFCHCEPEPREGVAISIPLSGIAARSALVGLSYESGVRCEKSLREIFRDCFVALPLSGIAPRNDNGFRDPHVACGLLGMTSSFFKIASSSRLAGLLAMTRAFRDPHAPVRRRGLGMTMGKGLY